MHFRQRSAEETIRYQYRYMAGLFTLSANRFFGTCMHTRNIEILRCFAEDVYYFIVWKFQLPCRTGGHSWRSATSATVASS